MAKNINGLIINWYEINKRNLPWRETTDPYRIWVSEIILQQTKVQQGKAYYERFIETFSTIKSLAEADEQLVLQLWQGLGYYSRARNLHKTAKIIVQDFNGIFPSSYMEILKLPGIGDYTASAISAFAFNEHQAVLDGNVFRVLSRIFNWSTPIDTSLGKKEFRRMAQDFLGEGNASVHNQAMMEFGAILCTPKNPACSNCPISAFCESHKMKTVDNLPVKSKKNKVRTRHFHFLEIKFENCILIEKRKEKDIWQHLYQLPLIEITDSNENLDHTIKSKYNLSGDIILKQQPIQHLLSHQKLNIHFYEFQLEKKQHVTNLLWVEKENLKNFPFPKPLFDYLDIKDS